MSPQAGRPPQSCPGLPRINRRWLPPRGPQVITERKIPLAACSGSQVTASRLEAVHTNERAQGLGSRPDHFEDGPAKDTQSRYF